MGTRIWQMKRIYTDFFIVIDIDIVIVIEKDRYTDLTDETDFLI